MGEQRNWCRQILAGIILLAALWSGTSGSGQVQQPLTGASAGKPANAPVSSGTVRRSAPKRPASATGRTPGQPRGNGGITANSNAGLTRNRASYAEAYRRYRRERHDRSWWKQHFTTIVFVGGGYYYWDAGYWFPAWGYDPTYENYEYDGPIFTYGNLLPDQVVLNVQKALEELGYYSGPLTGSLSAATRAAIATYQQDAGLDLTGAVDAATVSALGLY